VAAAMLVVGVVWIGIGLDPSPDAKVAPDFRPFALLIGIATIVAGVLTAYRRRDDIVLSIIGALTGATFAVATALLTRPETSWAAYGKRRLRDAAVGRTAKSWAFRGARN
jgi:uncharacterized membrane protein (UPF0136 family)